ncbi:PucR C-terminal helix-turn-helix domain-containing protein [Lentzea aerocolonigenes]|nr:PucR C-terminal helix-turn-helix domain-containing protein [Lentzea aerocolonigenes]
MTVRHELDVVLADVEALYRAAIADEPSELDLTRLRELGIAWGRRQRPLAPLVLALRHHTESAVAAVITGDTGGDVPRLVEAVRRTEVSAVCALASGFEQAVRGEDGQLAAANLLWGGHVPPEPDYAVIALRCDGDLGPRIGHALTARGRLGAVHLLSDGGGFLLAPAHDEKDAVQLCEELREDLADPTWLAVTWRPNTEIEDAGVQASVVLDLVTNLAAPPGVYDVQDVVVEYALMRDTEALVALLALIAPVVHHELLRTTVETLVATAGNRSKAASTLNIHRSTLDYRLNRVGHLTGCAPMAARGLQTLATALTLHAVVHRRAVAGAGGSRSTTRTPW